jgi:drug/metabolite transporter (DMT)-like permease
MLITLRTGIAVLARLPFLYLSKLHPQLFTHWRALLFVGLTNTAIPFCLLSYSTIYWGAGYATVFNATAPMFAVVWGMLYLQETLTFAMAIGAVFILLGVALSTAVFNARSTNKQ